MSTTPQMRPVSGIRLAIVAVVCAAVIAIVAWAIWRGANSPARYNRGTMSFTAEEVIRQHPWLGEVLDQWSQKAAGSVEVPRYRDVAAYPVGNGKVFGIVGLQWPFSTVSNLIGPGYQKKSGFFGSFVVWVVAEGQPEELWDQSVSWASGAPVVVVNCRSAGELSLTVYYFAVPGAPVIGFVVVVGNSGKTARKRVGVALSSNLPAAEAREGQIHVVRGPVVMRAGLLGARGRPAGDLYPPAPKGLERRMNPMAVGAPVTVVYPLGSLGPTESVAKIGYIAFSEGGEDGVDLSVLEGAKLGILEACRTQWVKWSGRLARIQSSSPRVDQFFQAQKYILLAQRSACGAYSPMHGYTYAWVRDSNGPLRFLAAAGGAEDVRAHLEYHFRGCAVRKQIGNNLPLELPVPQSVKQPEWSEVPVEHAEVPSFVILQHYWYYRASGDITLVKWHWGMLRRCLLGQALDERGTLPFHGDETYRFPGYELFRAGEDVRDWVCLESRSADSAFEYVVAAQAMARFAEVLGLADEARQYRALADRVRAATEKLYWQADRGYYAPARSDFGDEVHRYAFANVNLRPLWVGYGRAEEAQQRSNVLGALKYLWKGNGLVKTTPGCGYYVGMTPGYVLYNLAELRHPAAKQALEGLLNSAEASGGFAEMNTPEDRPAEKLWGLHRARPWEGGINAEAVLHALTGFEADAALERVYLRPLPLAGEKVSVKGLPVGPATVDLTMSDTDGKRHYLIEVGGVPASIRVDLAVVVWGRGLQVRRVDAINAPEVHAKPGPSWPWAQEIVLEGIQLSRGHPVRVSVEYQPAEAAPLPRAEAFEYGRARVPEGVAAIVVTPSGDKVKEVARRAGGRVYGLDTKIPWPASYLRSAVLAGDRPRTPLVVLDVQKYPGAFKRPEFWTEGEGARILEEYKAAGGRVAKVDKPSPPPTPYGGLAGMH